MKQVFAHSDAMLKEKTDEELKAKFLDHYPKPRRGTYAVEKPMPESTITLFR